MGYIADKILCYTYSIGNVIYPPLKLAMLHVLISYVAIICLSVMDIILQKIVNPPSERALNLFGINQRSLKDYFQHSLCDYLLIKFNESIKFAVKYSYH